MLNYGHNRGRLRDVPARIEAQFKNCADLNYFFCKFSELIIDNLLFWFAPGWPEGISM